MGHRRFLPRDHHYRRLTEEFDGNEELGRARKSFDAFSRVENMNTILGKRSRTEQRDNWKKRSIFWDLPYWKSLEVLHSLDVMHIEKNVCDSLLGLLLNIPRKTKDGINARRDMEAMGIRKELAPIERANSIYLPPACYTMSGEEKRKFCQCLHDIKVPSNYSANIKSLVSMKDCYLEGVKSIGVPKSRHSGRLAGVGGVGKQLITPPSDELQIAHFTVLQHMTCIAPYVNEHKKILRLTHLRKSDNWYAKQHNEGFSAWLKKKVEETYGEPNVDKTVERLGIGPDFRVISYQGYDINGYTFYTKNQDDKSVTQNSGVTQIASRTNVDQMTIAKESYYGVIQEIWELSYSSFTIPLFRSKWVNNRTGVNVDEYGFTLVDLTTDGYKSEPFILATQATQVFFVKDPCKPRYHIVLQGKRRILGVDDVDDEEEYNQCDELPPFSVSIQQSNDYITIGTSYLQ
ncbi:uncharacterized protein LOC110933189 [Helianthus annuus]|uniref:uncharacterized protein LOC110933189 n=1 Tax=Helianthus annuus TaxID=4232 RepID=UPI000B9013B3|nr:uncharacterized protein LOC110933189 [Helianthus annuus]